MENISRKIQKRENPNNIFYTPQSLVEIHLKLVQPFYKVGDSVLDPFYGQGVYYNLYSKYFEGCVSDYTEIAMGRDFFEYNEKVSMIVSNPPYSCIQRVLEKCVSLQPHTISLLIGHMNITTKRIEFMEKNGYKLVQFHLTKVYKWFGMSSIVTFSKEGESCISYDRIIHK